MFKKRQRLKAPLVVIGAGLLLIIASYVVRDWHKWEPVSFPVDLGTGQPQKSLAFRIGLTTNYLIELDVDRNLPFGQLNCLLGINLSNTDNCTKQPSPIELRWTIFSSNIKLTSGLSRDENDGAWGTTISRTLGRFHADKDKEYIIQVESLNDASILAPANPRITVRTHPYESKSYFLAAQMGLWGGVFVSGLGLMLGLLSLRKIE